ncbi:hypothetical protein GFL91_13875 [Rhizobium leguminosarum bv. viciae]|uniref:Uncharacterized protein n=1 Tax=Rhizobium leguminosarum bv. viciae TaxID=387 RepID=A0A8I2GT63_RHILV|nr:hypothetical protein [Rhizobium leguminosarum]MBY5529700.1 hypothetical protein [Rhizobium leguminosarum]NKM46060.1 hypothetical protein [Rhizobium leguminosarum bv. viciae]
MAGNQDEATEPEGKKPTVDTSVFVNFKGTEFFPLNTAGSGENPCSGKTNGTSCGHGCICYGGQCHYTLLKLQEMGITLDQ